MNSGHLALLLKQKAHQLGFKLVGIALPQRPVHLDIYLDWLKAGRQADMHYLAAQHAIEKRADPCLILPECRSILVLGLPYANPQVSRPEDECPPAGRIAAYAWGTDYHLVLAQRLPLLVAFLEEQVGHPIPNRWYTDTGPILERDLAMRAGLGWIGKNTCLINPRQGSYFLLSEILLGIDLPPDEPFTSDQCGSCTRCIEACPTSCILPDRTLDAGRCISYQTIENKASIPADFRPLMGNWVFGCDICQIVCPWNVRFSQMSADLSLAMRPGLLPQVLVDVLALTPQQFNSRFKDSPVKRAKRRGYLRSAAIAAGNSGQREFLPALEKARDDDEPLVREAAEWAIDRLMQIPADDSEVQQ